MQCPKVGCGGYTHRVDDTDGRQDSFTMRRCFCPECGHQFATIEYPVDAETGQKLYLEYVKPAVLAMEAAKRDA